MAIDWLKLDINILSDSKIKLIRKHPDGNSLFVLWVGLLCLAMKAKNPGYIEIADGIPYSPEDLATEFDLEIKTVQLGLSLFKRYQMIDLIEGNTIEIVNFRKRQSLESIERTRELTKARMKIYREKNRKAIESTTYDVSLRVTNRNARNGCTDVTKNSIESNSEAQGLFEDDLKLSTKQNDSGLIKSTTSGECYADVTRNGVTSNAPVTPTESDTELDREKDSSTRVFRKKHTIVNPCESSPADAGPPYQEILSSYRRALPGLPQPLELNKTRKSLISSRWREKKERQSLTWWDSYFAKVSTIPFLVGNNNRDWQANFDWLLKPSNMTKVLEGAYTATTKPKDDWMSR